MRGWEELEGGRVKSSSLCGGVRTIQELDGLRRATGWEVGGCRPVDLPLPVADSDEFRARFRILRDGIISFVLLFRRFSLVPGLHPDWMLMLFFAHTHLTVTVSLCLLLVPKVT